MNSVRLWGGMGGGEGGSSGWAGCTPRNHIVGFIDHYCRLEGFLPPTTGKVPLQPQEITAATVREYCKFPHLSLSSFPILSFSVHFFCLFVSVSWANEFRRSFLMLHEHFALYFLFLHSSISTHFINPTAASLVWVLCCWGFCSACADETP